MKKIAIIGSGFAGLASAALLAKRGFQVTVVEKNDSVGGRARSFRARGFTFDMGPSWYWMPDVFEDFFAKFGKSVSDFYQLDLLDPSYAIFFGQDDVIHVPASVAELEDLFDSIEAGSVPALRRFLAEAQEKYRIGMRQLVHMSGQRFREFMDPELLKGVARLRLHMFRSFHTYVRKYFRDPRLIRLLEFPILFLGGTPRNTPALYSMMNYAGLCLGTWYPQGGMYKIVDSMIKLAKSYGVTFRTGTPVSEVMVKNGATVGIRSNGEMFEADAVIANADYHHVETELLSIENRTYGEAYWDSRILAPSSLIFYLGVKKKVAGLQHHNLFFDTDFDDHAKELYDAPQWPSRPLFYVCCPSKTDTTVAPNGRENLFILMPIAVGLQDPEEQRERYFDIIMERLEKLTGESIRPYIVFKKSYCVSDFRADYGAFKGNAYGLANTLRQTGPLKPSLRSKKVKNLFFAGHLTVPGPGVPPSLISGQIAANEIMKIWV